MYIEREEKRMHRLQCVAVITMIAIVSAMSIIALGGVF